MVYKNIRSSSYKLLSSSFPDGFDLSIVETWEEGTNNAIVVNESASGEGGVVYNNGRLQETIPVNGMLLANSVEQIKLKKKQLRQLADRGEIVEFITPFKTDLRSNKFFIQDVRFSYDGSHDKEIPFTMTLTEVRSANVKTIAVNLVNFETAEYLKLLYNERIGNV